MRNDSAYDDSGPESLWYDAFRVPVTDADTWRNMPLRERLRSWVSFQATSGGSFPLTFYLRVIPKLLIYAGMLNGDGTTFGISTSVCLPV